MATAKKKTVVKKEVPAVKPLLLGEKQLVSLDKFTEKIIARVNVKVAKKIARFEKKRKGLGVIAKAEICQMLKDAFSN